jgi:hypothetical protein
MRVLLAKECYDRAASARQAEAATSPDERSDLLQVEWRWLLLARRLGAGGSPRRPGAFIFDAGSNTPS